MADSKLLNVGPKSAAWLRQVGVRSMDDLRIHGAVGAFWKVKKAGFRPSLNLLYALAGAVKGCHWTALSAEEKTRLVTEAGALEDAAKAAKSFVLPARDVTPTREDRADEPVAAPALFDEPDPTPAEESPAVGSGSSSVTD
ncbi:MAG: TfoX/Sxy family protein [Pseudomonadota bacterium]|jgi:DNA transformation protein